jgi:putative hemolysin
VNVKDLLAALRLSPSEPTLQSLRRSIPDFGPDVPVARCLERLIREHTHIALVRTQEGAVLGMVTLEDLMEELVGEIEDEFDRLPAHAVASGNRWIVGGGISLARLKELTGIDLVNDQPERAKQLLNDWMSDELGRAVQLGEVMQRDGLRIVVRKVRRNKVQEAQLERTSS